MLRARSWLCLFCGLATASTIVGATTAHAQHRVVEALLREVRVTGSLQQNSAEAALRGRLRALERCLTAPFRVGSAELHVTLMVGPGGRVSSVTMQPAPLPRPAMRTCVLSALRATRFAPRATGSSSADAVFEINW